MSRVGIILQARMGSSRLPGKVLRPMAGKPMLRWCLESLSSVTNVAEVVLATSDGAQDDPVAALGLSLGVPVFRGHEHDVLDRFYQCARAHDLDVVVRATGDNPLVDPGEIANLVSFFTERKLAYAHGFPDGGSGFPIGVAVEVFTMHALERAWREATEPHHREHVNEFFLENPDLFPQAVYSAPSSKRKPDLRLTVDTAEDFERVEGWLKSFLETGASPFGATEWMIRRFGTTV